MMHVICAIDDEMGGKFREVARILSRRQDMGDMDVRFCFLLAGRKLDPGKRADRLSEDQLKEVQSCPITDLYDRISSLAGKQMTINDRVVDLAGDLEIPVVPLTVHALAETLRVLLDRLKGENLMDRWFFACDVQLDDDYTVWPLCPYNDRSDAEKVDADAQEFDALLRASGIPELENAAAAAKPYKAFGLFCAWLIHRHKSHVAIWSSRVDPNDTKKIVDQFVRKETAVEAMLDDLFQKACQDLGIQRPWLDLAKQRDAVEALVSRYQEQEKTLNDNALHNVEYLLGAAKGLDVMKQQVLYGFRPRAEEMLRGLGTDKDVLAGRKELATGALHGISLGIAKTKAVVYRSHPSKPRIYLFDLLDYLSNAHGHPVTFNGNKVETLSDMRSLVNEAYAFNLDKGDLVREVFGGMGAISGLEHRLSIKDGVLLYNVHARGEGSREEVSLTALLWRQGNMASLVQAMQVLFGPALVVIPEQGRELYKFELERAGSHGLFVFVWPTSAARTEFSLSLVGHWSRPVPDAGGSS